MSNYCSLDTKKNQKFMCYTSKDVIRYFSKVLISISIDFHEVDEFVDVLFIIFS